MDRTCPHCSKPFTPRDQDQIYCGRTCANKGRFAPRTTQTDKLCACGSGLKARRTTLLDAAGFGLKCSACQVKVLPKYPEGKQGYAYGASEHDARQAAARRKLAELREQREFGL